MTTDSERAFARQALDDALLRYERILTLPQTLGGEVYWPNGVIWTRVGDNDWRSDSFPDRPVPSTHVVGAIFWSQVVMRELK